MATWYRWIRAPEEIKNAILAYIADKEWRIAATPAPILMVHDAGTKVAELIPGPIRKLLDDTFDGQLFVAYHTGEQEQMIAVWCNQLGVELEDA